MNGRSAERVLPTSMDRPPLHDPLAPATAAEVKAERLREAEALGRLVGLLLRVRLPETQALRRSRATGHPLAAKSPDLFGEVNQRLGEVRTGGRRLVTR